MYRYVYIYVISPHNIIGIILITHLTTTVIQKSLIHNTNLNYPFFTFSFYYLLILIDHRFFRFKYYLFKNVTCVYNSYVLILLCIFVDS